MTLIEPLTHASNTVRNSAVEQEVSQDAGLSFHICQTQQEVAEAWELLYRVYLKVGYIAPNPFEMHTSPCAVGAHTAVMQARIGQVVVGTISSINDSPLGLPLDKVYPRELQALRDQGCKLAEVGLFADRREGMERSFTTILELMRYTYYFSRYSGGTDVVCGIPPRRAKLYAHAFGFDIIGQPTTYAAVQDNPVVLLRTNLDKACENRARHRGFDYFLRTAFDLAEFDSRFMFGADDMAGSLLEQYARTLTD